MAPIPLADLSLFPATLEQATESRRRHHAHWGVGASLEDYQSLWTVSDSHEHAVDGKFITWVLAPRNDPQTLDFMSSCETFRRTAIVAKRVADGEVQYKEVSAFDVGTVYTPADKRKNGYAQHMMRLMHWVLAPRTALPAFPEEWGTPPVIPSHLLVGDAQFSTLYSAVGRSYYSTCGPDTRRDSGWLTVTSTETVLLSDSFPAGRSASSSDRSKWRWLQERDLHALWEKDAEWMKEDLCRSAGESDRLLFSLLPNKGVAALLVLRTAMGFTQDMKPIYPSALWGVQLADGGDRHGEHTFATWTYDVRTSPTALIVNRIRAATEVLFLELLQKIAEAAWREEVDRVVIWGLEEPWQSLAARAGWNTTERQTNTSAYKWYGEPGDGSVQWKFNEHFSFA